MFVCVERSHSACEKSFGFGSKDSTGRAAGMVGQDDEKIKARLYCCGMLETGAVAVLTDV